MSDLLQECAALLNSVDILTVEIHSSHSTFNLKLFKRTDVPVTVYIFLNTK